jgi:hypothetical protein
MRLLSCLIAVFLPAILAVGCLTVSPDECWVNTSGGLGGSETIPIGAGVGATSGGDSDSPSGESPNPCTAEPATSKPDKDGSTQSTCELPNPAGEVATSWSCGAECSSKCPAPGRGTFVSFTSLEFPFVTTIQDDGTDKGGGYQEAKVNLEFVNIHIPTSIISWWCPFTIGMPLRTAGMGKVSASLAASLSGEVTVGVARDMDYDLPQGIFCSQFVGKVDASFKSKYKLLGAKATQ